MASVFLFLAHLGLPKFPEVNLPALWHIAEHSTSGRVRVKALELIGPTNRPHNRMKKFPQFALNKGVGVIRSNSPVQSRRNNISELKPNI